VYILWLSQTEFISRFAISTDHFSYSMRVHLADAENFYVRMHRPTIFDLHAHSIDQLNRTDQSVFGPCSDLPLRLFRHVLMPLAREVLQFKVQVPATSVDAARPLVSITEDNSVVSTTQMIIKNPTADVVRALSTHPIHQHIVLQLSWGSLGRVSLQEANDLLLEFQFPVHLYVPQCLLHWEPSGESFAANPAFSALTIKASEQLSQKLLDGIAHNKHLVDLTIDFANWGSVLDLHDNAPAPLPIAAFCCGRQAGGNLKRLSLVSHQDSIYGVTQKAFEKLSCDLDFKSKNSHAISRFRVIFPRFPCKLRPKLIVKSNAQWDSKFSPSLVVNCLHGQPGGCPPASLAGLAVQRINQGMLFKHATDLVPCDLSVSNASAIFEIFHHSARHDSI
jgi:hypothetical protein